MFHPSGKPIMATVGVYARIDTSQAPTIREDLNQLPGVSTFELDDPQKLGLIIEAPSVRAAHDVLTEDVAALRGVLAAWPVYMNVEDELPEQEEAVT